MSKKTLNAANLKTLGAARLADLLIEVSTGSADIKRRLRLELSHNLGPADLSHEVRKRLMSLRKSRNYISWRKRKALVKDLDTQRKMITEKIAPDAPDLAFDLLWTFLEIAPSVLNRTDDSRGEVGDVFRAGMADMPGIAPRAGTTPETLADRVLTALLADRHGVWDGIIAALAPSLGVVGLSHLSGEITAYGKEAPQETATPFSARRRARFVQANLQQIAAASGDTAAYIAQYSAEDLARRDIAAEVAQLLLRDGQGEAALATLRRADQPGRAQGQAAWDDALIATLTALGQDEAAQAHRWTCFEATLHPGHLRAYLKRFPDFDDVEAEDAAKRHVLSFPRVLPALAFCLDWPDLLSAAELVTTRASEIDGARYDALSPAAEALRLRHPLAAVLLWRTMIDFALTQNRVKRYGHVADHLADCAALDLEITDYGLHPNHDRYVADLRARHGRKSAFWAKTL